MKKLLLILLPILLLIACDSTYQLLPHNGNTIKMERGKSVLLTTVANGYYKDKEYKRSGKKTADVLTKKLRPYVDSLDTTPAKSFSKIDSNVLLDYDYIICPEIYHWEDRATSFSSLPDKIILGITVYDNTGNVLNHIEIKAESSRVEFFANDPIDLIDEALDMYIRQLFEFN